MISARTFSALTVATCLALATPGIALAQGETPEFLKVRMNLVAATAVTQMCPNFALNGANLKAAGDKLRAGGLSNEQIDGWLNEGMSNDKVVEADLTKFVTQSGVNFDDTAAVCAFAKAQKAKKTQFGTFLK